MAIQSINIIHCLGIYEFVYPLKSIYHPKINTCGDVQTHAKPGEKLKSPTPTYTSAVEAKQGEVIHAFLFQLSG